MSNIMVIVKWNKKHDKEYIELFNKLDHSKFKSKGSIVYIKGSDPWHDYSMKIDDFVEFYNIFKNTCHDISIFNSKVFYIN